MNIFVLILNSALVVKPTNPESYTSCPCEVYCLGREESGDWLMTCFEKGCCNNENTSYFTSLKIIHVSNVWFSILLLYSCNSAQCSSHSSGKG